MKLILLSFRRREKTKKIKEEQRSQILNTEIENFSLLIVATLLNIE